MNSAEQRSFMCTFNEGQMNFLMVMVFMMSFLLFKYFSNTKSHTNEEIIRKSRRVEKYLNKYKQENEDFFIGNRETDTETDVDN
jgi:hypothetical protein